MWINERVRRTLMAGVVVALAGVVAAGCGDDDPAPPTTGDILIIAVTTGDNPDADGYTVTVDGNSVGTVDVNGELRISNQTAATYLVGLTDVAPQCTVAGDNPRDLVLVAGTTTSETFNVDCAGAPQAVTIAAATAADEVTLTWALSALATSYRAELVGGTADLSQDLADDATTAVFTATDDGLEDGVTYAATVYAINAEGETPSNEEDVATNFFPWDEYFPTSLHETGQGKIEYYSAANGGFERFTGKPYTDPGCIGCHSSTDGRPPVSGRTCDRCHTTADPQLGAEDVDDSWDPATSKCLSCHSRQKAEIGAWPPWDPPTAWTDVHRDMGFGCMDCHTPEDVHGDGTAYNSLQDIGAIDANCTNCHDPADHSTSTDPHAGAVACASCHAQTVTTCNNCHFEAELAGAGKVFPTPPKSGWILLANRLKRDGSGETEVYPANFQSVKYTTDAGDSTSYVAFGYYTPHTIGTGRDCSACHTPANNPAVQQYNTDGFIDMAWWDDVNEVIVNPNGVVPIPEDYLTSLRFEFVSTDVLDPPVWEFYKASADTLRIPTQWITPLSTDQMDAIGMTGP
jgi:hypothetical protein